MQTQKNRYKHISQEERVEIYKFFSMGKSQREISRLLWRSHSTIGREIRRNSADKWWGKIVYKPLKAQKKYEWRRYEANKKHTILLRDHDQREKIKKLLLKYWDSRWPDEILWRLNREWFKPVSTPTLYRFIRRYWKAWEKKLRFKTKGYKHRGKIDRRGQRLANIPLITERPKIVETRERVWDWEWDTIVSNRSVKWWAVTLVDRKSRYLLLQKVKDFQKDTIATTMIYLLHNEKKHTITIDNWVEFSWFLTVLTKLAIDWYLAHPYASYERWTNEKHNDLIRRYIPKWIDINQYSDTELRTIKDKLNHKPRKILNYKTPYEVYHDKNLTYIT